MASMTKALVKIEETFDIMLKYFFEDHQSLLAYKNEERLQVLQKDKIALMDGDILGFNIGGKRFSLSKKALMEFEKTYFHKMIEGKAPITEDKDKYLFIDRNGSLFPHIIEYIYNREIFTNDRHLKKRIIRELKFYGLIQDGQSFWVWDKM